MAGDQGERPDGTGRVAPADGCAERQSPALPSPAASVTAPARSVFAEPLAQARALAEELHLGADDADRNLCNLESALDLIEQRAEELQAQAETADHHANLATVEMVKAIARAEAAEQRAADKETALERAVYIAEHLFQMVPREAWREQGAEWMGQYEGDHHAEQVRQELAALSAREEQK